MIEVWDERWWGEGSLVESISSASAHVHHTLLATHLTMMINKMRTTAVREIAMETRKMVASTVARTVAVMPDRDSFG